jgi:hypothetical protein
MLKESDAMSHAEVRQFFETYRDNFNRLDADAVADTWHTKSGITHRAPQFEEDIGKTKNDASC